MLIQQDGSSSKSLFWDVSHSPLLWYTGVIGTIKVETNWPHSQAPPSFCCLEYGKREGMLHNFMWILCKVIDKWQLFSEWKGDISHAAPASWVCTCMVCHVVPSLLLLKGSEPQRTHTQSNPFYPYITHEIMYQNLLHFSILHNMKSWTWPRGEAHNQQTMSTAPPSLVPRLSGY